MRCFSLIIFPPLVMLEREATSISRWERPGKLL